jgi:energy-coupling factor transporter transmembrane protein EcfT
MGDLLMDDIHSILVSLISNLVWLPIGAFLALIGYFIQVRLPHRRLWRLGNPANLVICAATSTTTNTGVYHRPATGIGQVRALALAIRSLNHAYQRKMDFNNILLSIDHLQERIENDLLLLGGPKNNQVSERFLKTIAHEQPAMQVDTKIIWRIHRSHSQGQWINQGALYFSLGWLPFPS